MSFIAGSYVLSEINFDKSWIEQIILKLAREYNIRVLWNKDTVIFTSALALAGVVVGGYSGGRLGAALGAGIGGATGFVMVSLREIWPTVKEKLEELIYIVINYLRRIDPVDYVHAFNIVWACTKSRRELIVAIVDFIALKLDRQVYSSITAA